MSPIAATRPAATLTLTPVIVSKALDRRILDHLLGDVAVEKLEILAEPIELAQVPLDCGPLVDWQLLSAEPVST